MELARADARVPGRGAPDRGRPADRSDRRRQWFVGRHRAGGARALPRGARDRERGERGLSTCEQSGAGSRERGARSVPEP